MQTIVATSKYVAPTAVPPQFRATTEYLVIHHAGAVYPRGEACQRIFEHHSRRWPKYGRIGYHCVLQEESNGEINNYWVNPKNIIGAHVLNRNAISLGICAATNFKDSTPSSKWFDALVFVARSMSFFYPEAEIVGHREIATPQSPTICPGSQWFSWKDELIAAVRAIRPTTPVIGVTPSCTRVQFLQFLSNQRSPLSPIEADRVFTYASWLEIDPAFIAAMWHKEQWSNEGLGQTEVGKLTRNPLNVKSYGRWPSANVKGASWNVYESWQIGMFANILHLKQFYGAEGLLTLETIVPVFAPASDGNSPTAYITKVLRTMKEIRSL